jgi:hypothetical protein
MNTLTGNNLKMNGLGSSDKKDCTGGNDKEHATIRPQEINLLGESFNIRVNNKICLH